MTREEAIQVLKNTAWLGSNEDREATEEAIAMAIEALSAEPKMKVCEERQNGECPFYTPDWLDDDVSEPSDEDITDAFMQGYLKGKADRPQGEWTNEGGEPVKDKFCVYCSKCKEWSEYATDYCPNCGADMRGDNNG